MAMDKIGSKQPYEAYYVKFNFANLLDSATIASAVTTAIDLADSSDATSDVIDGTKQSIDTPDVNVWIKAGETGHQYKLTCRITASDGALFELDCKLPVTEI